MNCGNVLADKWRFYQMRVIEVRAEMGQPNTNSSPLYMDGTTIPITAERRVLNELDLIRYCCRKHFLTHVDLNEKV